MSGPAKAESAAPARLAVLDALRIIAALGVVVFHLVHHIHESHGHFAMVEPVARFGYLGVQAFFVLSGFVILWSALGRSAGEFVLSRLVRLWPSYLAAMLLTTAALAVLAPEKVVSLRDFLLNAIMAPALPESTLPLVDDVYWTLFMEARFYALIFLLLLFRQSARVELWLHVWLAGVFVCTVWHVPPAVKWLFLQPYGAHFLAGCFFCLAWQRGCTTARTLSLTVCVMCGTIATMSARHDFISPGSLGEELIAALIMTGCYAVFAMLASGKFRNVSPRWITAGAVSYPLYLIHNSAGKALFEWMSPALNPWLKLLIVLSAVSAVAWAMTVLIELKLVPWLRRRFCRNQRARRNVAADSSAG